ncbi:hypothetical protein WJX72_004096 [[Myrmecia] bisecta]|uniref:Uncharacterized protein n=1 Tax=[Myrmecia] bisecta TaxID=41462 RepID=A0AAW1R679_9CHLO
MGHWRTVARRQLLARRWGSTAILVTTCRQATPHASCSGAQMVADGAAPAGRDGALLPLPSASAPNL